MERICHPALRTGRDRVPAACSTGRDQVIPGRAHLCPFSQGLRPGRSCLRWAQLGGSGSLLCHGQPLQRPWSRLARDAERPRQGPGRAEAAGPARGPGPAGSGSGSGALPSCPVPWKGSPVQRGEFLGLPLPWVTWGEGGRPGGLAASCGCGTAAECATTTPQSVAAALQRARTARGCPSRAAGCLSGAAAGFSSQSASILVAAFFKAVPLPERVSGLRGSN